MSSDYIDSCLLAICVAFMSVSSLVRWCRHIGGSSGPSAGRWDLTSIGILLPLGSIAISALVVAKRLLLPPEDMVLIALGLISLQSKYLTQWNRSTERSHNKPIPAVEYFGPLLGGLVAGQMAWFLTLLAGGWSAGLGHAKAASGEPRYMERAPLFHIAVAVGTVVASIVAVWLHRAIATKWSRLLRPGVVALITSLVFVGVMAWALWPIFYRKPLLSLGDLVVVLICVMAARGFGSRPLAPL